MPVKRILVIYSSKKDSGYRFSDLLVSYPEPYKTQNLKVFPNSLVYRIKTTVNGKEEIKWSTNPADFILGEAKILNTYRVSNNCNKLLPYRCPTLNSKNPLLNAKIDNTININNNALKGVLPQKQQDLPERIYHVHYFCKKDKVNKTSLINARTLKSVFRILKFKHNISLENILWVRSEKNPGVDLYLRKLPNPSKFKPQIIVKILPSDKKVCIKKQLEDNTWEYKRVWKSEIGEGNTTYNTHEWEFCPKKHYKKFGKVIKQVKVVKINLDKVIPSNLPSSLVKKIKILNDKFLNKDTCSVEKSILIKHKIKKLKDSFKYNRKEGTHIRKINKYGITVKVPKIVWVKSCYILNSIPEKILMTSGWSGSLAGPNTNKTEKRWSKALQFKDKQRNSNIVISKKKKSKKLLKKLWINNINKKSSYVRESHSKGRSFSYKEILRALKKSTIKQGENSNS